MAEVLIVAKDRPVADSPGKWRKGDIVTIQPDGWVWGRKEGPPAFVVVSVPGEPGALRDLLEPDNDAEGKRRGRRVLPMNDSQVDIAVQEYRDTGSYRSYRNENQFRAQLSSRDYIG